MFVGGWVVDNGFGVVWEVSLMMGDESLFELWIDGFVVV